MTVIAPTGRLLSLFVFIKASLLLPKEVNPTKRTAVQRYQDSRAGPVAGNEEQAQWLPFIFYKPKGRPAPS